MDNTSKKCEFDFYQILTESIRDVVFIFDREEKIVYTNNAANQQFHGLFQDLIGRRLSDIFPVQKLDNLRKVFGLAFESGKTAYSEDEISFGDKKLWMGMAVSPIKDEKGKAVYIAIIARDISKDKDLLRVATDMEQRYIDLIQNTPLCIKVFGANGNLTFVNKGGRIEHFIKDDTDISKWDWMATVKEPYRASIKEAFAKAMKGESSVFEFEHKPEGSSHEWCSSLISPIKDENGNIKSILFYSFDITALKKEEIKVKEGQEMFKALLDNTPLCIKWFGTDGNLISVNAEGRKEHHLEGVAEEEVKNWNYMVCIKEQYQPIVKEGMARAFKGEISNFEMEHVPDKGHPWCQTVLIPVKGEKGRINYVLFVSRNITKEKEFEFARKDIAEREDAVKSALFNILDDVKETEVKLKQESERSQAIIASMGDGLMVVDKDLNVVLSNNAVKDILGVSMETLIGRNLLKVFSLWKGKKMIPDKDRPIWQVLNTGKKFSADLVSDYYFQTVLGVQVPVSFVIAPLISEGGAINGAVLVFRDISKDKRLDEAKTNFISVASHQLRTPLTSIKWIVELLLAGDFGALNKEQNDFLKDLATSANRMVDLVNGLLDIARIESAELTIIPENVDFEKLYKDIIKELTPLIVPKNHLVQLKMQEGFSTLKTAPRIFYEVLKNLLSNSIKYTPENGKIEVRVSTSEQNILIDVQDNGLGVPKQQQNRIFEKFFRGENVVKINTEGTGLGMYIVKQLVETLGGKISFESEENKGTTFHIILPLAGPKESKGGKTLV